MTVRAPSASPDFCNAKAFSAITASLASSALLWLEAAGVAWSASAVGGALASKMAAQSETVRVNRRAARLMDGLGLAEPESMKSPVYDRSAAIRHPSMVGAARTGASCAFDAGDASAINTLPST